MNDILQKIVKDIQVELSDEFDKNFQRKAFFNEKWPERKRKGKGSLLLTTGKLRRSIRAQITGSSITWTSSEPYAAIHNEGGTITVIPKMKKLFWRRYYEALGGVTYNIKSKSQAKTKRNENLNQEAEFYKAMALMKVGSKITIPKRQFIGISKEVKDVVEKVFIKNLKTVEILLNKQLKIKK